MEATSAMSEDRPCELHDDQHPATYWCFECEQVLLLQPLLPPSSTHNKYQGMCDAAHVIHSKAKSSKHHQTSEIGSTSPPVVRKQVTCTVHGKETNLVCTHPSHSPSPQMICISCVVTSHQSHPCMTAADFFVGRQAETQALLKHARVAEERLARVAEVVWKEHASVAQNRDSVRTSIYGYFTKVQLLCLYFSPSLTRIQAHHELDNHQKQLLTLLDSTSVSKEEVLAKQGEGLLATLDGIKRASLQLEVALSSDSQAKALVLMQQLQQHLKSIEENDLQPRDLAGMTLHEVSYSPPEVYLVDAKASEASVTSTGSSFPVILLTCIPLSRFEINGIMKGEALRLQTTSAGEGRYNIQAEEVSLEEQIVHVRLLGQHIKGSPVRIPGKRSWSPTNTARTVITDSKLEAKEPGAWGMVREEFGMSPRSLIIRIDHQKTNKWAQLALYTSSTVQLNAGYELPDNIATYNTNPKVNSLCLTLLHPSPSFLSPFPFSLVFIPSPCLILSTGKECILNPEAAARETWTSDPAP